MCLNFLSLCSSLSVFLFLNLGTNKGKIEEEIATSGKNCFWSIVSGSMFMTILFVRQREKRKAFKRNGKVTESGVCLQIYFPFYFPS